MLEKNKTKMEESHTAEHITQTLKEVISDWDIPGTKIVSVIHDNATNMAACTNQLAQDTSWGTIKGVHCVGHTLQLCINSALKKDPVSHCCCCEAPCFTLQKKAQRPPQHLQKNKENRMSPSINLCKMLPLDGILSI